MGGKISIKKRFILEVPEILQTKECSVFDCVISKKRTITLIVFEKYGVSR